MKPFLTFALCLLAIAVHAATPSTKSFRGAGGILVTSNDTTAIIIIDGSSISSPTGGVSAATATNISQYFVTNSTGKPAAPLSSIQFNSNGVMQGSVNLQYTNGVLLHKSGTNFILYFPNGGGNGDIFENVSLGYKAGNLFTGTGSGNIMIGFEAGQQLNGDFPLATGNTLLGYKAGLVLTNGDFNTIVGAAAGFQLTGADSSTLIGHHAGGRNLNGPNTFVGELCGEGHPSACIGTVNTVIGSGAFVVFTSAQGNSGVGNLVFEDITSGNNNSAIGLGALKNGTTAANNLTLGYLAGQNITTGNNNLILGYSIDAPSATGNNQMSIGNLIFGTGVDGTGTTLSSGNVGIGTASPFGKLHIQVADATSTTLLRIGSTTGGTVPMFVAGDASRNAYLLLQDSAGNNDVELNTAGDSWFNGGRLGIGTVAPSSTLDVTGQVRAASAIFTNTIDVGGTITANQLNAGIIKASGSAGLANVYATNFIYAPTNTGPVAVTTNLFAAGTRYTNDNRRSFVTASIQLSAAAAGTAKMTLYVENAGSATNRASVSAGPLASLITVEQLMLPVGPSMIYYFTDETSGVGATASIVANTCSIIGF